MLGRKIRRTRSGELQLRLSDDERELLRSLPGQLRDLMAGEPDDPTLRRLFPPAYTTDTDLEAEYRRLMGHDLQERHLAALALMEETVDAERLADDQAAGWLSALNDLRLVLGTRLDVSEDMLGSEVDPADPQAPVLALYGYLSWLEEQLVEALAAGL
jgi:hypothetical protein